MIRRSALAMLILVAAHAAAAAPILVHVDAATQARLGVTTALLAAATRTAGIGGYAKALDPQPLASLDADILAAAAALEASRAQAARAHALFAADQAVAAKVVEAADVQARADAARLTMLRRRVGLEWGPGVAGLSDARRTALVGDLAAGRTALVRIDTPSGLGQQGLLSAEIELGPLGSARAMVMGPARAADAGLMSPGLLARVDGRLASALPVGLTAPVRLTISRVASGVILPRSALIRTDGQTWAYVRKGPADFERRAVINPATDAAGLFVAAGFKAGEPVVTTGAAALFAAESASAHEG